MLIYNYTQVCKTIPHPQYDDSELGIASYDYAIIRLCQPIAFSQNITSACLPSNASNNYDNVKVCKKTACSMFCVT